MSNSDESEEGPSDLRDSSTLSPALFTADAVSAAATIISVLIPSNSASKLSMTSSLLLPAFTLFFNVSFEVSSWKLGFEAADILGLADASMLTLSVLTLSLLQENFIVINQLSRIVCYSILLFCF